MAFLFFLVAISSVSVAYFLRGCVSGENLKVSHSAGCLAFNWIFCFFYLKLAREACISFLGCFPEFINENPAVFWTALVCLFLHAYAFPVDSEVKCWVFRKKKSN